MPPGSRSSSPRCVAGRSARGALYDLRHRNVEFERHRRRRQHVRRGCPGRGAACRASRSPAGVSQVGGTCRRGRGAATLVALTSAAASMPNVTTRPRNHSRARHHPRDRSAFATSTSSASRAVEDLGLGVGDRVGRFEEARDGRRRRWSTRGRPAPRCRPACESLPDDSCPARRLRSPAWRRSSSSESGRPMWLLRFPLFLNTRYRDARNSAATSLVVVLPALPVIATTLRARPPPHVARDVLQRRASCRPPESTTGAGRCPLRRRRSVVRPRRPPRPALSAVGDELVPVEPLALDGDEAIARRAASANRSRSARSTVAGSPRTTRPPAAAATSAAVSASGSTRYDTRERARRRASALLATSTSSNGSTRPPISWYFSWPLPATSTRSPGTRVLHRPLDRRLAIDDREIRRRLRTGLALRRHAIGRHHDAALDLLDDLAPDPRSAGCPT